MRILEPDEVMRLLHVAIEEHGSQLTWAREMGLDRTGINKALHGKRPPTEKIIRALGLRRVCVRGMRILERDAILRLLRSDIARSGSQTAWAKQAGVARPLLNHILHGKRPISEKVIFALKLRIVVVSD